MKPHLSFWQVVNMNVGFFGIQFSFGLKQSNMSPMRVRDDPAGTPARPQRLHSACLTLGGAGLLALPLIHSYALLFVPMLGLDLA